MGQSVLITGGASGLGMAIAQRFVEEGANVAVLDRSPAAPEILRAQLGDEVVCAVGDVRKLRDNQRAVQACVEAFGGLDCVIGNAGIWDYSISLADLPEEDLADSFDEIFHVNVLGYLMLAKASMRELVKSQGSIVYTVSNAGYLPDGGGALYTASKHAVVGLIKQLAFEFAPHVRVNGVAPGPIATQLKGPESLGMQDNQFPGDRLMASADRFVPIGVMPSPAQYAGAYVFLASGHDAMPATGTVMKHDGGFSVRGFGKNLRGGDELARKLGLDQETAD